MKNVLTEYELTRWRWRVISILQIAFSEVRGRVDSPPDVVVAFGAFSLLREETTQRRYRAESIKYLYCPL